MEEVDINLKASMFTIIVASLFAVSAIFGVFLMYNGYGIPSKFQAMYWLDSYNILAGVGKQIGKPVIYEWIIVTLLKPGTTRVYIHLSGITALSSNSTNYVTIQFYFNGKKYEVNKPDLNLTITRNNIFFAARVKLVISPNMTILRGQPIVYVNLASLGRT